MPSINPITGTLGRERAAHLLRRATFGLTIGTVNDFASKTISQAMADLLVVDISTDKPLNTDNSTTSFLDVAYTNDAAGAKLNWVQSHWLNKMREDNTAFFKVLLFWNNHFAISAANGQHYIKAYKYYKLLQKHALGNFRDFIIEITKDPLMLDWLDGHDNQKGANNIPSNENYARELQELFMIGATQPDGTPNYTEDDVREAARVLTGWRIVNANGNLTDLGSQFSLARHDTGNKTFSSKYKNTVILGRSSISAGDTELGELVDMILAQPESAKFICRKIYQWFVASTITPDLETDIIIPLANTFRSGNYQIKPVLEQLLSSEHFYEQANRGAIIKHPLDFILNMSRLANLPVPNPISQTEAFYNIISRMIRRAADDLQMDIMRHETVFGWDAYYQPEMYKLWINSTAIRLRNTHADLLVTGFTQTGFKSSFDALTLTENILTDIGYTFVNKNFPDSTDTQLANKIIEGFCFYLYPQQCPPDQQLVLRDALLYQGELNEVGFWFEWKYYKDGDNAAKNGLRTKLSNMIRFMWKSAQFQLI
jgi:uncharacterized protein (DUF1800 family)